MDNLLIADRDIVTTLDALDKEVGITDIFCYGSATIMFDVNCGDL